MTLYGVGGETMDQETIGVAQAKKTFQISWEKLPMEKNGS
jgi:hypothetical protein